MNHRSVLLGAALVLFLPACGDMSDSGPKKIQYRPYETQAEVLPQEPPANSICTDRDWCWIHPAPSAHFFDGLTVDDDGTLRGTAYLDRQRGYEIFKMDDEISIQRLRGPDERGLESVNYSENGWLVVNQAAEVREVDFDGVLGSTQLPEPGLNSGFRISGKSINHFLATSPNEFSVVVRDGQQTRYGPFPAGPSGRSTMWINGEIWETSATTPGGRAQQENWRHFKFPDSNNPTGFYANALGPSPASACASEGAWLYGKKRLLKWDGSSESWRDRDYGGPHIQAFGCDERGRIVGTNWDGQMVIRTDRGWRTQRVAYKRLDAVAAGDSKTYIAGNDGTLVEMTDGDLNSLTSGFQLPNFRTPGKPLTDLWINADGSRATLTHRTAFYHGSDGVWRERTEAVTHYGGGSSPDEVWGIDRPTFGIRHGQFFRWDGESWNLTNLGEFDGSRGRPRDIAGSSLDNLWFLTATNLYAFQEGTWSKVEAKEESLQEKISESVTQFRKLLVDGDQVLVATGSTIYKLTGAAGDRSLEQYTTPPCTRLAAMHRTDSGTLYASGKNACVARRVDGTWEQLEQNFNLDVGNPSYSYTYRGPHEFVGQPGSDAPLVATDVGLLAPDGEGNLERRYVGKLTDAEYVPDRNVTLLLHQDGVLAKYHNQ